MIYLQPAKVAAISHLKKEVTVNTRANKKVIVKRTGGGTENQSNMFQKHQNQDSDKGHGLS